jgi:glycine oxidase
MYPAVLDEVERTSGVDVEYKKPGMVRTARTAAMARNLRRLASRRPELEWVEAGDLSRLEPGLARGLLGGAFSKDDADLNPARLAEAFAVAAEKAGADVRPRTMLTGILRQGDRVEGVSTNLGDVRGCDALVLAAGPWTQALAMRLDARLPTPPVRGQMLAFKSDALKHAVWGEDGYLLPKPGGYIWAGATVEDVGFRKRTTARGLANLRGMAAALVPSLRSAPVVRSWAGLRPGSADGLPVMGRLPGTANVYVATGHFRNGILLAPITGALMAGLVLTGKTDRRLRPFAAERFLR